MTATIVIDLGRNWRFVPETPPLGGARAQAIARGQLIDELTGRPPPELVTVSTRSLGVTAHVSAGGMVGLSGRPLSLYPNPWPAISPRISLQADSSLYLPVEIDIQLPAQPGFPDDFTLLELGVVELHRLPTWLRGRVESRTTGAVAGADITVDEIWPSVDAILAPGDPPNALSIWAGLYADRPIGASVRRRTLTLQPSPKQLLRPVVAGDLVVKLSDRQGLLVGRPIAIEPSDPERVEYVLVTAIDTTSSADQPADITLAHGLRRSHAEGVPVARTNMAAAGPVNSLTRDARGGDFSLYTDGLTGLAPGNPTLEVDGGGPAPEYHGFALWQATTAADGTYVLPPIHRIAHLRLTASGGGQPQPVSTLVSLMAPGDAIQHLHFP